MIRIIPLTTRISKQPICYKAGAFADDVNVLCKGDIISVQAVFDQYEKLTRRSGLELNADKTEILSLKSDTVLRFNLNYLNTQFVISTITRIKICGIWYCNNKNEEYRLNITDKIAKMNCMLKKWRTRNLTYEGKSLIIKTFGLSQLIYTLQVYSIKDECIKTIERSIFGFIWH